MNRNPDPSESLSTLIRRKTRALKAARRQLGARTRELDRMRAAVAAREKELAALHRRSGIRGRTTTTIILDDLDELERTPPPTPEQRAFWYATTLTKETP